MPAAYLERQKKPEHTRQIPARKQMNGTSEARRGSGIKENRWGGWWRELRAKVLPSVLLQEAYSLETGRGHILGTSRLLA